jgi:hypothetical protein
MACRALIISAFGAFADLGHASRQVRDVHLQTFGKGKPTALERHKTPLTDSRESPRRRLLWKLWFMLFSCGKKVLGHDPRRVACPCLGRDHHA